MHARIDGDQVKLLTRTGLDWSHRYRRTIEALGSLKVKSAYVDGELCALYPNGVPSFSCHVHPLHSMSSICGRRRTYLASNSSSVPKPIMRRVASSFG